MKHRIFGLFLILGILWTGGVKALAAEPVQVTFQVCAPGEHCQVQLLAEKPQNPMPQDSSQGSAVLEFQGEGAFPPMEFQSPGIYRYTLTQIPGADPDCRYDTIPYHLQVTVTEEEGSLGAVVIGARDGVKANRLEFKNLHRGEIPKTGDPGNWIVWMGLMLLGGIGSAILCYNSRKE